MTETQELIARMRRQKSEFGGISAETGAEAIAALEHLVAERDAATRAWEESSHAMDQWRAKALAAIRARNAGSGEQP